jgi:tRNA threonylcarbamoyl adenosine modification protein (Sua5/YciO/YrdC/YwlC family)
MSQHIVAFSPGLMQAVLAAVRPALLAHSVIAVPTDTIYGLACLAQSQQAVDAIYAIKGRDEKKPIAICVSSVDEISEYGKITVPMDVLHALLPGPVTVVFERTAKLNPALNPFTSLIGIRVPDHPLTKSLVEAAGQPLALTSANRSGEPSTLDISEFTHLWPQLAVIVDGGRISESRSGSTVVDLSQPGIYTIIRPGDAMARTCQVLESFGIAQQASRS